MDPNANLKEQREIAFKLLLGEDDGGYTSNDAEHDAACRLAELVEVLDGWLSKGGFLPEAWARNLNKMQTEADIELGRRLAAKIQAEKAR